MNKNSPFNQPCPLPTYRVIRFALLFVTTALMLLLVSCTQPEIEPLRFESAPWGDGEASRYAVTDLDDTYAGTARFDISRMGAEGWNIRRETVAQGITEIVAVDVEGPGYRPRQSTLVRLDNSGTEQVRTAYDGSDANLELTTKQDVTTNQRISVPSDVRDRRTLFMLIRSLPLQQGFATRLNSFLPVAPLQERMTIRVLRQEEVEVPAGTFTTWYVTIESPQSESEAWVSVEPPYPVVRFIDGRNGGLFELTEFLPGISSLNTTIIRDELAEAK